MGRIALTGAGSFLGSRLLERLAQERGVDDVVAVDIAEPPVPRVRYREVDLSAPAADQRLLEVFRDDDVDTVVHAAFFTNPRRETTYAHELESIGTLSLLAAAAAAGVGRVVLRSFTAVYGARGQNPNFLGEDRALPANPALPWLRDKCEAEQHAASFAKRFPAMRVTTLRLAPLLGPGVQNFYTRLFDGRVVPVVLGYDPLVQLLHPEDAVAAFERALGAACTGPVNVVPRHPIPLLTAVHLAEKIPLPVPHTVGALAADLLWASGIVEAPGGFVDFARFLFVADGEKAEREMGFRARYDSREALDAYLRSRDARTATAPSGAAL
jgi:UDP-glucose 4-epimerase